MFPHDPARERETAQVGTVDLLILTHNTVRLTVDPDGISTPVDFFEFFDAAYPLASFLLPGAMHFQLLDQPLDVAVGYNVVFLAAFFFSTLPRRAVEELDAVQTVWRVTAGHLTRPSRELVTEDADQLLGDGGDKHQVHYSSFSASFGSLVAI